MKAQTKVLEIVPQIRSRLITDCDIKNVAGLLAKGFPRRSLEYWLRALSRLARHPTPDGFPKYGYLMEANDVPVGVILLIFSTMQDGDLREIRCCVSSWYAEPIYRSYATLLISQAIKNKDVTYLNISPAPHTRPIIEAQGFSRYSGGQFVSLPAFSPATCDGGTVLGIEARSDLAFEEFERKMLLSHAEYKCTSFWIAAANRAYPFVFLPRLVKGWIPCVQLIYCRDVEDFVRFSRTIGLHLLSRGRPIVLLDSNGPIPGLLGKYVEGASPKYFKGPKPPRLGDLAYTEAAMFGL